MGGVLNFRRRANPRQRAQRAVAPRAGCPGRGCLSHQVGPTRVCQRRHHPGSPGHQQGGHPHLGWEVAPGVGSSTEALPGEDSWQSPEPGAWSRHIQDTQGGVPLRSGRVEYVGADAGPTPGNPEDGQPSTQVDIGGCPYGRGGSNPGLPGQPDPPHRTLGHLEGPPPQLSCGPGRAHLFNEAGSSPVANATSTSEHPRMNRGRTIAPTDPAPPASGGGNPRSRLTHRKGLRHTPGQPVGPP